MKFYRLLLTTSFFLLTGLLDAQVNFTAEEYGVAGDTMLYSVVVPSARPGGPDYTLAGANVNWNFSTITPTSQYTLYFLNPDNAGYLTPYVNACVSAGGNTGGCTSQFNALTDVAFLSPDTERVGAQGFDNIVTNDLNANNQLVDNIIGITTHINGAPVAVATTLTAPDVVRYFPISYGNADSSFSSYTIDLTPYGANIIYKAHTKRVIHDDAWGSLTTPYQTYASVVREFTTVTNTDTIVDDGVSRAVAATTTVEYDWFDPANIAPVMMVTGTPGGAITGGAARLTQVLYQDKALCFPPVAHVRVTPANPKINPGVGGVTVTFTNTTTHANTYEWNFDDPGSGTSDTSSLKSPTHKYDTAGTYVVEFIACNTACNPQVCDTSYYPVVVQDSGVPVAAFRARPATVCENDTVTFNNTSRSATSYEWSFGDGSTSTLEDPTTVYSTTGTFTVTLVAYNNIGYDTATHTVTVQAPPTAVVQESGPTTFCNGDSVLLSASGGSTYRWSNGRRTATINVKVEGTYTVTVTNSCGTATSTPITVTVNTPVDTIVAMGDTTICEGDSVRLQANDVPGGVYSWKRNNRIIAGARQDFYYVTTTGNYEVNILSDSCVGVSNIIRVTVNAAPAATITAHGRTTNCSGDSVLLTTNVGANLTWQWQKNGQNILGATSDSFEVLSSGTYEVVATRGGCSVTSRTIIVNNNATPAPVIDYNGNPAFCAGDSLELTTPAGTGYTYQWLLNGVVQNGAINEYYYAVLPGSYTVIATAGACAGTSPPVVVTQNPLPVSNAGSTKSLQACTAGIIDTLGGHPAGSGGTAPYTYFWAPSAGLSSDIDSNPAVSNIGVTTEYYLQVTDHNGCSASDSVQVTVTGGTGISAVIPFNRFNSWCYGSGDSVKLVVTVSGGTSPYTYNWTPMALVGTPDSPTTWAGPSVVGVYTFSVVVTDNFGCQGAASTTLTVYALPNDTVTVLGTTTPCRGDSVTLAAAPGSGYDYQWLNNSNVMTGVTGINLTTASAGNYSVQITNNGCSDTSAAINVTPASLTAPAITGGDNSICAGQSTLLSVGTGTGYTYQWYENDLGLGGADSSSYLATDSASYYAVVTSGSCSAQSDSVGVAVYQYPNDSVSVNGPTSFCSGGSVALNAQTGTGYTYQWLDNSVEVPGATTNSLTVDSSGLYAMAATANGCTATSTEVQVQVTDYPSDQVTANSSTTFCQGDSVTLSAPVNGGYTYQWLMVGDSTIDGAINNSLTVYDSASYAVVISNGSCIDTSSPVAANVLPAPNAGIQQVGNTLYAGAGETAYQWYSGSSIVTGANSQLYSPVQSGTFSVLVTDSAGCTGLSAPYAFIYTRVNNISASGANMIAYPNPAQDVITILLSVRVESAAGIRLYDLLGKQVAQVFEGRVTTGVNRYSLNLLNLAHGVYLLKADFGDSAVTLKVVKQ